MMNKSFFNFQGSNDNLDKATAYNKSLTKRIFNVISASIGFVFLYPIFIITIIAIRIDSPGHAIFKQKRVGIGGNIFYIYKFRSMKQNADDELHQQHIRSYAENSLDGTNGYKVANDPRITKFGHFLRKTKIDELPQLINVIKGEMSLVGPRPVPIYEADLHNLWHGERMNVLPGITGLWQVLGLNSVSMDDQMRLDIRYIRNQSLWFDIKIIFATIISAISILGVE